MQHIRALACVLSTLILVSCAGHSVKQPVAEVDLLASGRIEAARAAGQLEQALWGAGLRVWQENLDAGANNDGDDPLTPGCACRYRNVGCGGGVVGRAVDECFPHDGVSLNEKVIDPNNCDSYSDKTYNCETLLGKGATCKLQPMTCCGVETSSAYCYLNIEL